jgi:Tol biopolymer transport system component
MTLSPGARLGPYEITGAIGAGGMGEVFRARDPKLNRDVAIKVLPAAFADDPERLARFTREAQTLASLNHPNIAAIYGIEESVPSTSSGTSVTGAEPVEAPVRALVMELVEGEDLSVHIARGPIAIAEALPIARQIAEALEAAHEQGIVHRDLKPANIKVRSDGTVKVLDFGLAKAMGLRQAQPPGDTDAELVEASPTMSRHMTEAGMIIGTAAYMSPEQAKGKSVDKRTDIWAFGVVLYEMMSGKRAFKGEDVSETLASVLKDKVPMDELPAATPPRLKRLIERCLNRDLKTRLRDIGEARIEIAGIETGGPDGAVSAATTADAAYATRSRLPWALVAVLTITLAAGLLAWAPWRAVPVPFETRLDINTQPTDDPMSFAISPDGRRMVFVATGPDGKSQLWLRPLDQTAAQVLPGTEDASYPFWSPDSRSVAFFTSTKLKRLDIGAGLPQTLVDRGGGRGGSWSTEGIILTGTNSGPLSKVSASGGATSDATKATPAQGGHRWPHFLPGGRQFLFYVHGEGGGLYLGSLDSLDSKRLAPADSGAQFVAPDWLLFLRQGTLMAQHLDLRRGELTGEPVSIAEQVAFDGARAKGAFSVSHEGSIANRTGAFSASQFTWFDRSGKVVGTLGSSDRNGLSQPTLSPDGRRVAAFRTTQGDPDLWLFEAGRETRFTFEGGRYPLWSPDGARIAFADKAGASLKQKSSAGGGAEELLLASSAGSIAPYSWSPDGRFLIYNRRDPVTTGDLWVLPLDGKQKPSVFLNSKFEERLAQFSPDGRWVAYTSDESGRNEVYLRPFPASSGQFPVSTLGGTAPRWRKDGKELFYIAPDGRLMAVTMGLTTTGRAPAMGAPVALFQPHLLGGGAAVVGFMWQYDVAPDGRFLINVTVGDTVTAPITVIQNWNPKK